MLGRRLDEIRPDLRGSELIDFYRRAVESGTEDHLITDAPEGPDAGVYEISTFPLPEGASVLVRDVTARQARERELEERAEAATWLARIRKALDQDRFVLHAQPIIRLETGEVEYRELLLRMVREDGTLIAPGDFLPTAERFGLVGEIDGWVVRRAARLACDGLPVMVNMSAASITHPSMLAVIESATQEAGADPGSIVFEITETAFMEDAQAGGRFATELVERGFRVALDDFGTGFGGFSYLKRLPAHFLKIDMEFVRDALSDFGDRHVITATVALAGGFDQQTVGEGVENEETLALLRELGVTHAQGFHIGRPAPL